MGDAGSLISRRNVSITHDESVPEVTGAALRRELIMLYSTLKALASGQVTCVLNHNETK